MITPATRPVVLARSVPDALQASTGTRANDQRQLPRDNDNYPAGANDNPMINLAEDRQK